VQAIVNKVPREEWKRREVSELRPADVYDDDYVMVVIIDKD
jgi:hypothetical protein